MRKNPLPQREKAICARLREAREELGKSQQACAEQIGLDRATFVNYEVGRTPLRFEVALRFCRQMIVSEEWLATGKFEASWSSASLHGVSKGTRAEAAKFERMILRRQCVDLRSDPLALHIPTGTLFSEAYDKYLAARFSKLVRDFFFYPRIVLSEADQPEIALNLLTALNERFFLLLANESARVGGDFSLAWRHFARCQFEVGNLIFLKFTGTRMKPEQLDALDWLRYIASDPDAKIGPLQVHEPARQARQPLPAEDKALAGAGEKK